MKNKRWWTVVLLACLNTVAWAQPAVIRTGYLKVFESPEAGAPKVMTLTAGDTVEVVEQQGAWVKLQLPDKRFAWMQLAESPRPAPSQKSRRTQSTTTLQQASADMNVGISLTLGSFGENFAPAGRFLYRTLPEVYIECVLQHAPGEMAGLWLAHSNLLYSFSLAPRWHGWITGGVGVMSTPVATTVGAKTISNMDLNYGIGVMRHIRHRIYGRGDIRRFSVLLEESTKNYLEVSAGVIIGLH